MLPIRSILHPTDFSEASKRASEFALGLAKDYRARLILLHVIDPNAYDSDLTVPPPKSEALRRNAEIALESLLPFHDGVYIKSVVTVGPPAPEILDVAAKWNVDLIVLATHGRVGISRLLMGSIAEEVLRRASCPVIALTPAVLQNKASGHEDRISASMGKPKWTAEDAERDSRVERVTCLANGSFSATVEHTVRASNRWLRDIRMGLSEENQSRAFRILRAVLHALRDHLPIEHVASLSAQLPLLLRGVLFEEWGPTGKPRKERHKADFIKQITSQLAPEPLDEPEIAIRAVFAALAKHLTAGETAKLKRTLPHEIRDLLEAGSVKPMSVGQ